MKLLERKIKSHALVLTITIATVVFIFISSFLLIEVYDKKFTSDFLKLDQEIHNLNSGQVLLLQEPDYFKEIRTIDLGENNLIEISVFDWGIYQLGKIKNISNERSTRVFFIGYSKKDYHSIELQNTGSTLKFGGNTHVNGPIMCPYKYYEIANIYSTPFTGNFGKDTKALETEINYKLPFYPINIDLTKSFTQIELNKDSIFNSFNDSTLILSKIESNNVQGFILINSSSPITIRADQILKNVIIKAPVIHIESNFTGSAQFLANDSIVIADNVHLNFPSALIIDNQSLDGIKMIKIGNSCTINGVVQIKDIDMNSDKVFFSSGKNCIFNGELFIHGIAKIENINVNGRICANRFITSHIQKTHYNTFIDSKIDGSIQNKHALFCKGDVAKILDYAP